MSVLPYLFVILEGAQCLFREYRSDGSEVHAQGRLVGIASERKNGINFMRDIDFNESSAPNKTTPIEDPTCWIV